MSPACWNVPSPLPRRTLSTALSFERRAEQIDEVATNEVVDGFEAEPIDHAPVQLRQRQASAVRPRGKKPGAAARVGCVPAGSGTPARPGSCKPAAPARCCGGT